jgi:tagatose 6-phosphate kinase
MADDEERSVARFIAVTPNPAIDVTYSVTQQVIGETVRVRHKRQVPGGKGINVARVLAQLGCNVTALQPLGGDPGRWIAASLREMNINAVNPPIQGTTRTTVTVVDDLAHPTLYSEPGPVVTTTEWSTITGTLLDVLRPDDWVIVAGSFPPGLTSDHLSSLVRAIHTAGARVLVDTSGPMLLAAAEAGADYIKANRAEVTEATSTDDLGEATRRLIAEGSSTVISLGADGAIHAAPGSSPVTQEAVPGVSGNPTGAGDASTAGFIAALAQGHDIRSAMGWAAVCGAAAVRSPIAGSIDIHDLDILPARLPDPPAHPLLTQPFPNAAPPERSTS